MAARRGTTSKGAGKGELVAALRAAIAAELEAAVAAHKATVAGATHEEAKPENDKDTRALEQTYLARGQAARVADLTAALAETQVFAPREFGPEDAISLGALVTVEDDDGAAARYFVAPQGGGARLASAEGPVIVVTPRAPLGAALLGKAVGDDVSLPLAGRLRAYTVLAIR